MKSYFLENIAQKDAIAAALSRVLPGQSNPWLLQSDDGDAMAYFNIVEESMYEPIVTPAVQVDISGRHYYSDAEVIAVLTRLQALVGGEITDDQ